MTLNDLLAASYAPGYVCRHFAADVWRVVTGEDARTRFPRLLDADGAEGPPQRDLRNLRPLAQPSDPCIVIMRNAHGPAHAGVYFGNRIMHLTREGARYEPVARALRTFSQVSYYR